MYDTGLGFFFLFMWSEKLCFKILLPSRFTHAKIENLQANKEYKFRVTAENLYGRSEPCEPTGVVRTEEAAVRRRPGATYDDLGRLIRGKYDGPKIDNYDKFREYTKRLCVSPAVCPTLIIRGPSFMIPLVSFLELVEQISL